MKRGLLIVAVLCAAIAPAHALSDDDERAKAHFLAGQSYYDQASYTDALREFNEAYRISKRPALLYNIARCFEGLEQYQDAVRMLERYLDEDPQTSDREAVETRIHSLERARRRRRNGYPARGAARAGRRAGAGAKAGDQPAEAGRGSVGGAGARAAQAPSTPGSPAASASARSPPRAAPALPAPARVSGGNQLSAMAPAATGDPATVARRAAPHRQRQRPGAGTPTSCAPIGGAAMVTVGILGCRRGPPPPRRRNRASAVPPRRPIRSEMLAASTHPARPLIA